MFAVSSQEHSVRAAFWRLGLLWGGLFLCQCRGPDFEAAPTLTGALTGTSREAQSERFWGGHQVSFAAEFAEPWAAFGEEVSLSLRIQNGGLLDLALPMRRTRGVFPFRRTDVGRAYLDLTRTSISSKWGTATRTQRLALEELGGDGWNVAGGTELRYQLPLSIAVGADTDFVEVMAQVVVFPVAVEFDGEPLRFAPLRFPPSRLRMGSEEAVSRGTIGDLGELHWAADESPENLVSLAVRFAEWDLIEVTDRLVDLLPGPTVRARAATEAALRFLTTQPWHGVERWRSWWESQNAVQWAQQHRQRRSSSNPETLAPELVE